jgi:hypothetical protein
MLRTSWSTKLPTNTYEADPSSLSIATAVHYRARRVNSTEQ